MPVILQTTQLAIRYLFQLFVVLLGDVYKSLLC